MVTCHATGYGVYRNIENGRHFCSATKQEEGFRAKPRKKDDEPIPCDVNGAEIVAYFVFGMSEQSKKHTIETARELVEQLNAERGKQVAKRVMQGQPTRKDGKTRSQARKRKVAVSA